MVGLCVEMLFSVLLKLIWIEVKVVVVVLLLVGSCEMFVIVGLVVLFELFWNL